MTEDTLTTQVRKYFDADERTTKQILNALSLYIYSLDYSVHDLYILARLCDSKTLSNIVSYYDGAILKIPSKEQYTSLKLLSVSFYLREIQKLTWEQIRELIGISEEDEDLFSSISFGKKINSIKEVLAGDMKRELEKYSDKNAELVMEEFLNE